MAAPVEQFFQSYAQALNRWLVEPNGFDAVRAHLADPFVLATPDGLRCGRDDEITGTMRQTLDFWRSIGVTEIAIRVVDTTPIDETGSAGCRSMPWGGYSPRTHEALRLTLTRSSQARGIPPRLASCASFAPGV